MLIDRGKHILRYGRSIASGSVAHGDASVFAIVEVDVVGAYGGSAYKLASAAIEQRGIAVGACANDESVGISHAFAGELLRFKVFHLGKWLKQPLDVGDMAFYKYFHKK